MVQWNNNFASNGQLGFLLMGNSLNHKILTVECASSIYKCTGYQVAKWE